MTQDRPYLPIARPKLGIEELAAVRSVLDSGWLTQGPWVQKLENGFAARHETHYAVATTSCTTALHLALIAAGVGPGDEVIVPALTWIATANVVVHCGATPVFVDIEPETFNISADGVRAAIGKNTRAVIAVHLFGLMANMGALRTAVPDHIPIIEDAACAAGAQWNSRPAGSIGFAGCFSFHPRKSITCGEGGMITTNDAVAFKIMSIYRNHGADAPASDGAPTIQPYELPDFGAFGFNYRLTDIQAAVATVQMTRLDSFIKQRQALAAQYDKVLSAIPWLRTPITPVGSSHTFQSYVVTMEETPGRTRDGVLDHLHNHGIGGRPGTHSVVGLRAYRNRFGTDPQQYPRATQAERTSLALPLHNHMSSDDIYRVASALGAF